MEASRKKLYIVVVGIVLVMATVFNFVFNPFGRSQRLSPKIGDVVESIYGLGTVTADKIYHLRAGVPMSVRKVFVREGDQVESGMELVKFDNITMRSPISGTVTNIAYKDGELVTPQVSVITVTNLNSLFLEINLEQQSVLRVKVGQKVVVSFESLRGERFDGEVISVYPRDTQFIIRIEIKNWPKSVLPGMTADVAILVGKKSKALLIPLKSIVAGQVTRVRQGKKERIHVTLGVVDGEWAEVTSGDILETDEIISRK
jgi:membrane fusion protein, macrolide-specific efflux system